MKEGISLSSPRSQQEGGLQEQAWLWVVVMVELEGSLVREAFLAEGLLYPRAWGLNLST